MLVGCRGIDNPEGDLKGIKLEDWPLTDCSTSTRPVRDLVAYQLLGVPYKWEVDWMSGTTYIIQPDFSGMKTSFSYNDFVAKNHFSGTHEAYMNLIEGKTDVIIASRDISRNEKVSSEELGVELETAPLAIDALVFIVNPKNPVKNLTSDQVRKIYTGEIRNWKEVGGIDHAITPYIRNADSGSQEKMETLVMQGLIMIDRTDENYMYEIIGSQMISPYAQLEIDEYGIGYTPYAVFLLHGDGPGFNEGRYAFHRWRGTHQRVSTVEQVSVRVEHLCCGPQDGEPREYGVQALSVPLYQERSGHDRRERLHRDPVIAVHLGLPFFFSAKRRIFMPINRYFLPIQRTYTR